LLVEVRVLVPHNLTPRQRHLLEELAKEEVQEAQAQTAQGKPGQDHEDGLLHKLWHSFTEHKPK
jgi:DnaJ-class molecular chaperone